MDYTRSLASWNLHTLPLWNIAAIYRSYSAVIIVYRRRRGILTSEPTTNPCELGVWLAPSTSPAMLKPMRGGPIISWVMHNALMPRCIRGLSIAPPDSWKYTTGHDNQMYSSSYMPPPLPLLLSPLLPWWACHCQCLFLLSSLSCTWRPADQTAWGVAADAAHAQPHMLAVLCCIECTFRLVVYSKITSHHTFCCLWSRDWHR